MQFAVATESVWSGVQFCQFVSSRIVGFVEHLWSTGDEKMLSGRINFVETYRFITLNVIFVTEN